MVNRMSKTENTVSDGTVLTAQNEFNTRLWRNNSGVMQNPHGQPVRFGLGNTSAKVNKKFKSSDLIGLTPIIIQPYHVGRLFGVFTSFEAKAEDWKFRPSDEHAGAQLAFMQQVTQRGGIAAFINDEHQVQNVIQNFINFNR